MSKPLTASVDVPLAAPEGSSLHGERTSAGWDRDPAKRARLGQPSNEASPRCKLSPSHTEQAAPDEAVGSALLQYTKKYVVHGPTIYPAAVPEGSSVRDGNPQQQDYCDEEDEYEENEEYEEDDEDEEEKDDDDDDEHEEEEEDEEDDEEDEYEEEEDDEDDEDDTRQREMFLSKNGVIKWSSVSYHKQGSRMLQRMVTDMIPGPTQYASSHAHDITSTFQLLFPPELENIILEMTNREGLRKYRDGWNVMDEIDLRAYVGLLILAGVYRSRGESAASLWDPESGRALFRATMPLAVFDTYSRMMRFDERESRAARRAVDKLAAIRDVWDKWTERLPHLYNPGPDVTVDVQLVPFKGRCPFLQYVPSKPAKYGIKTWVACDATSSYAWKMQVCTGKPPGGGSEKNRSVRVVLDVTEGLWGHNVTCDDSFTSYKLGQQLLKRNITMVGTMRPNKPEIPSALLAVRQRELFSSKFAFTPTTTLVSYIPKKNHNVVLMSTLHTEAEISDREDRKPLVILDHNSNKGGVDNLDKVISTYSCRRMTVSWPLAVFYNIVDVSAYNAYVIWTETNPSWMPGKQNKRRAFLEQLGKALVNPLVKRRERVARTEAFAAVVKAMQKAGSRAQSQDPDAPPTAAPPTGASKRKRCQFCPLKKDCKTQTVCCRCRKFICKGCALAFCPGCAQ